MSTMKFEVQIHTWCKWIAQDKNGGWWEYSIEPKAGDCVWTSNRQCKTLVINGVPPKDFTKELYEVTQ